MHPNDCSPGLLSPHKPRGSSLLCTLMSHIHPTTASSPGFQLILNDALNAYKEYTKKDLLAHPLAARLQNCDSPHDILLLFHQQIQALSQSRSTHAKLTRLLDPTVNVLYTFAMVLGEGVNTVCFETCFRLRSAPSYLFDRYSHLPKQSLQELVSSYQCVYSSFIPLYGPSDVDIPGA